MSPLPERTAGATPNTAPVVGSGALVKRYLPWWEPQMTGAELDLIREVLDSNYLNDGEITLRFEAAIAARIGARHPVAVTSGTSALFLALAALGIGPGDEVIVPDLTFIATANAIRLAGATPVLADIDARTLTLDPAAFEAAITPRTRAVIPVHVSGRAADMAAILSIATAHGIAVLEDAAEAFASAIDGAYLGTIGAAGCLSFSPNKTITMGQGGVVVTSDASLERRLRELKDQGRPTRGTGGDDLHPALGYNFKLTNLQAAVGLAQLTALEERLARQRDIYLRYTEGLAGVDGIVLPGFQIERGECPLWTDALVERRDALVRYLEKAGIGCRRFWHPLHTQPPYRTNGGSFPNATAASKRALWLPSAFTLSDAELAYVVETIRIFSSVA